MKNFKYRLLLQAFFIIALVGCNSQSVYKQSKKIVSDLKKDIALIKAKNKFTPASYIDRNSSNIGEIKKNSYTSGKNNNFDKAIPLNRYPVHELRMAGIFQQGKRINGIILIPNGSAYLVKIGDKLGVEQELVTAIDQKKIYLAANQKNITQTEESLRTSEISLQPNGNH